jgi:hypothetical protein
MALTYHHNAAISHVACRRRGRDTASPREPVRANNTARRLALCLFWWLGLAPSVCSIVQSQKHQGTLVYHPGAVRSDACESLSLRTDSHSAMWAYLSRVS